MPAVELNVPWKLPKVSFPIGAIGTAAQVPELGNLQVPDWLVKLPLMGAPTLTVVPERLMVSPSWSWSMFSETFCPSKVPVAGLTPGQVKTEAEGMMRLPFSELPD